MDITFLIRGLVIGFSIAAAVGPISVLVIRRTLAEGQVFGFVSGLGAATADAMYGCIAAFGLTYISNMLVSQQAWFRLVGGLFLCYLGIKTFLARPAERLASAEGNGLIGAYGSTLLLTLTNPMTILSFAAVFAGFGVANSRSSYFDAALMVLGVFVGSGLWWLVMSSGVGISRKGLNLRRMRWVNRVSGLIVIAFGLIALWSLKGKIL